MTPVAAKLKKLCEDRSTTLAAACRGAGVNYGTLHAQISYKRDIPFGTLDQFGQFFDVPLEFFSGFRPEIAISSDEGQSILHRRAAHAYEQAIRDEHLNMMREGYAIGTDDVLNWLNSQGGRLSNFDSLRESVDLFEPVDANDRMLRPHRMGRKSLATTSFHVENEDHFAKIIGDFERGLIDRLLLAHRKAPERPYNVSDEMIDVIVAGERVHVSYRRIIAPVKDAQGNPYTLVHTKPF